MFWDVAAGVAVAQGAGASLIMPEQYDIGPISVVVAAPALANAVTRIVADSNAFARR